MNVPDTQGLGLMCTMQPISSTGIPPSEEQVEAEPERQRLTSVTKLQFTAFIVPQRDMCFAMVNTTHRDNTNNTVRQTCRMKIEAGQKKMEPPDLSQGPIRQNATHLYLFALALGSKKREEAKC